MECSVISKNKISVKADCFNPFLSALCGQAFRWKKTDGILHGVAGSHSLNIEKQQDGSYIMDTDEDTFRDFWCDYFDLGRDYAAICKTLCADESLSVAISEYYGIRIFKQEPWEALCSFIISQNNNIPRISGIIDRLCSSFGEKLDSGDYSFPHYSVLAKLDAEQLAPLRSGFRARYIIDAAQKLENGELSLDEIAVMPIEQARAQLMKIVGVGAKVAECTLLYGFGRMEAFPVDVWVKRIMAQLYPDGLPECTKGVEGIAQQYLFHWRRNLKIEE